MLEWGEVYISLTAFTLSCANHPPRMKHHLMPSYERVG